MPSLKPIRFTTSGAFFLNASIPGPPPPARPILATTSGLTFLSAVIPGFGSGVPFFNLIIPPSLTPVAFVNDVTSAFLVGKFAIVIGVRFKSIAACASWPAASAAAI